MPLALLEIQVNSECMICQLSFPRTHFSSTKKLCLKAKVFIFVQRRAFFLPYTLRNVFPLFEWVANLPPSSSQKPPRWALHSPPLLSICSIHQSHPHQTTLPKKTTQKMKTFEANQGSTAGATGLKFWRKINYETNRKKNGFIFT